jgi:hypothetical protein
LDALLRSLPSRADIEVLVVDDRSTLVWIPPPDGVHPFTVRVLAQSVGLRGAGAARNVGLEAAVGRFVFFADSDDLFETRELDAVLEAALALPVDCDQILFGVRSQKEDGSLSPRDKPFMAGFVSAMANPVPHMLARLHGPWGRVVRRSFLEREGIRFEPVMRANDVVFSTLVGLKARGTVFHPTPAYVLVEGSVSLVVASDLCAVKERMGAVFRANQLMAESGVAKRDRFTSLRYLQRFMRRPFFFAHLALWSAVQPGSVFGWWLVRRKLWSAVTGRSAPPPITL